MEMTMAILANERNYAKELAAYLNSKKDFIYRVAAFSDLELLKEYEKEHQIDMLLCDEDVALVSASELRTENICVLTEYSYLNENSMYPGIYKYQSLDGIIGEIMKLSSTRELKKVAQVVIANEEKRRIISVVSPLGGVYKTTFSLGLAEYFGKREKTLYLSLDPFFVFPGEEKCVTDVNMTDIIYSMESKAADLKGIIHRAIKHGEDFDYISGVTHWYDIFDIESTHSKQLLDILCEEDEYRSIIIDVGNICMSTVELLRGSTEIYVPLRSGKKSEECYAEWQRQLRFSAAQINEDIVSRIIIPFDSCLNEGNFSLKDIISSKVGEYIENMEVMVHNQWQLQRAI